MRQRSNILDNIPPVECAALELVRITESQIAVIPFTLEAETVDLHYCAAPEIRGYVHCNGVDCVCCQIGVKKDRRLLFPVYLSAAGGIGVLSVSPSLRPFALLPQLTNVLRAAQPMVMFISRTENYKYRVSTHALGPDMDAGEGVIEKFKEADEAHQIDLASVYQRLANEHLAEVPEFARMLALKGIPLP
jgi:hypothetical protein